MVFPAAAVERAMTYQQVILRALADTWTWLKAADVLALHPRSLRRWGARFERNGVTGLLDARRRRPSHRTAPRAEVQRVLGRTLHLSTTARGPGARWRPATPGRGSPGRGAARPLGARRPKSALVGGARAGLAGRLLRPWT